MIHNPQARVSHNILGLESEFCELWGYIIWDISNVITVVVMTITISLDKHAR